MQRRGFLLSSGIAMAGLYAGSTNAIAGPFKPEELLHNIPSDKKLDPQWVKSLYRRGFPTRYLKTRNELKYIGMPVGGLQTGTLYLGGDGRLWLWDIFNDNREGIDPKTIEWGSDLHVGKKVRSRDGSAYVAPAQDIRPVEQGFVFRIKSGEKTQLRKMEAPDWDEIIFEATYPRASVTYIDKSLGVDIRAEIFSPFIPLDEKNSSLPCTIYTFTLLNKTGKDISVNVTGWLGNKYPEKGNMSIAALSEQAVHTELFRLPLEDRAFDNFLPGNAFHSGKNETIGAVTETILLKPRESRQAHFTIAWFYPHLKLHPTIQDGGRNYSNWFSSSSDVVDYVSLHFKHLSETTALWSKTWQDSTLPHWFLERTFLNISTLATTTTHRLKSGRFYAWEGVGCCEGTCMHVWQYAQAMARVFPSIERDTRERVDLGLSLQPDGMIWYRGEVVKGPAIDGQAGTILRFYREHQMSADDSFLRNNWEKIRRATMWVIRQDKDQDGMEDTPIENTLDAVWDGQISWLVGLCIAAVKAGQAMAEEMNDNEFAAICSQYVEKGMKNMETKLFNGEYFIHRPDHITGRKKLGSYNTCHIDQVYGQSWAHQVSLGRVINQTQTLSALKALWKYNFTPDVGPYIRERKGGRPYALPGEGGMIMNTNPLNETKPYGENVTWQLGYFHECMSGFEHQVAAHMMAEGMVDEALVLTRMIHDRYHARKRNPFNEIECSDHYARAMASYGTFISACGFQYHGPKGVLGFSPAFHAEDFRAPFITAEGWGTYHQLKVSRKLTAKLIMRYGQLRLNNFSLADYGKIRNLVAEIEGENVELNHVMQEGKCVINFSKPIILDNSKTLQITVTYDR
jgi:non-lysosomal glucosylceramidase